MWRRLRHGGRGANNALLSGLYYDIEDEIFDGCRLLLDRRTIRCKSCDSNVERAYITVRRNRPGSTCLAAFTRQKRKIIIGLGLANALWFRGKCCPTGHRNRKACTPYRGETGPIANDEAAKIVDRPGSVVAVGDRRDSATDSNRRHGGFQSGSTLMAELPPNKAKRAFGKRSDHLASAGSGIIHKAIDHEPAVWTDIYGRFVEEKNLDGPSFRRLNSFVVHDPRPNLQNSGLSTWRRALRLRIDGRGCTDLLGSGGASRKRSSGSQ
jgi:hypothetical protein